MRFAMLGMALFLILCGQAVARPRDEVMINAYRCAGHASTRVWLDCYYGAAQPQRAALGLAPVTPAQMQLNQSPSAPGVPQDISARDTVMIAAARCGSIPEEHIWLDCYYSAANSVRALLGLTPTPGSAPGMPPEPPASPRDRQGNSGVLDFLVGNPGIEAASHMASYRFDRNGVFSVTLENGQVWQQLDGDGHTARWTKEPRSYAVTITYGAFKSFNLSVKGSPIVYKVRRVS